MSLSASVTRGFRLLLLASVVCLFAGNGPAQLDSGGDDTVECQCAYCRFGLSLADEEDVDAIILVDRWINTVTNGNTGSQGTPVTLTWSIMRDGTFWGINPTDMVEFLDTQWSTSGSPTSFENRPWFDAIEQGLEPVSYTHLTLPTILLV